MGTASIPDGARHRPVVGHPCALADASARGASTTSPPRLKPAVSGRHAAARARAALNDDDGIFSQNRIDAGRGGRLIFGGVLVEKRRNAKPGTHHCGVPIDLTSRPWHSRGVTWAPALSRWATATIHWHTGRSVLLDSEYQLPVAQCHCPGGSSASGRRAELPLALAAPSPWHCAVSYIVAA